ncbi:MAG: UvrB/UvrC motif-containing protein, partial [Methanosarcinales archaeon]|nr:UvrB/UvrC motif-containing protein [Methanosarcinales archaeon]
NLIIELEAEMQAAADALDFERAIKLRDVVKGLRVHAAG